MKEIHTLPRIAGLPDEWVHEERWDASPGRPFVVACPACSAPVGRGCVEPPPNVVPIGRRP